MTYLTKVLLGAEDCWRNRIRDDYSLHRFIYSLFPLENKAKNPRILYADKGQEGEKRKLYILSQLIPDAGQPINMTTVPISERFLACEQYRFEVLLNPVKRDNKTRKLIPVKGLLPLLQWFSSKAPAWGFQPDAENLETFVLQTMSFPKGDSNCLFHRVKFKGTMSVINQELFKQSFINGLGRGKSFGFGLLQLSPSNNSHSSFL